MNNVCTRFAPSPTGYLHIGGLRTALYSWLYAKQNNGKFILRIEDTDRTRCKQEYLEDIKTIFNDFELNYDEIQIQSENLKRYQTVANKLIEDGYAYKCYNDENGNECDTFCVKLNIKKYPENGIFIKDDIRNININIKQSELCDIVLLKSDGFPTYHLASVVDDMDSGITHIFRGDEWLSSLPYHDFLHTIMGNKNKPTWFHIPLITNMDGKKLSKRDNDINVRNYLKNGFLKESLLNFAFLLGWHEHGNKENYTIDEMIQSFNVKRLKKASAIFDIRKLINYNKYYIGRMSVNESIDYLSKRFPNYFNDNNPNAIIRYYEQTKDFSIIERLLTFKYDSNFQAILDFFNENEGSIYIVGDIISYWVNNMKWIINSFDENNEHNIDIIINAILGISENKTLLHQAIRILFYGQIQGPDTASIIKIQKKNFFVIIKEFYDNYINQP